MRTLFLSLLALVLIASGARAEHCAEEDATTVETPAGTFYVVNEQCQPGCLFSIWVYQESNGHPGLQRCHWADECCDGVEQDTIVF